MNSKNCKHLFGWQEKKRWRHYRPMREPFHGKCPKCKNKYSLDYLEDYMEENVKDDNYFCPKCNVELKPEWTWKSKIYCPICGKEKEIFGLIKQ